MLALLRDVARVARVDAQLLQHARREGRQFGMRLVAEIRPREKFERAVAIQPHRRQQPPRRVEVALQLLHAIERLAGSQPDLVAQTRQPPVGIVLPQLQTVFRPRGEEPVGLHDLLGHQVVDHHAQIRLVAPQPQRLAELTRETRGVHAGEEALAGRLLVARGAVELTRQEQRRIATH